MSSSNLSQSLAHFDKRKRIVLDSNLLVVYIIAHLGDGEIEKNKKTRNYTTADAYLLGEIIQQFSALITTPHILTETTNLLDWIDGKHRQQVFAMVKQLIQQVDEYYIPSVEVSSHATFTRLGLTDVMLVQLCQQQDCILLTADLDLYVFANSQHIQAINFHHLRSQ